MVQMNGWENVQAALRLGKGVVMTSAHFGSMEIVLYAMLMRGVAITIPVERVEPPQLFNYLTMLRTGKGLKLIPIDGPMSCLFRTLRRGGVAGIAGDRNVAGRGAVVPFFGAAARLPDGHVRLAMRTGAPLVLGFSRRLVRDRYQATFHPHFSIPEEGTEEERFAGGLSYVVRGLQKAIGAYPEQWAITTPMWADADRAQPVAG
jgi:KDO2-lipid IV(A) lauroyltransferase